MGLFEFIAKSRSGVYKNTSENRRLHRVGQRYGEQRQLEDEGELIPGMPNSTKVNLKKYLSDKIKKRWMTILLMFQPLQDGIILSRCPLW